MTDMTDKMKSFRVLNSMTLRNIKVYAKDRMAILLSLLTQIIVLTLYLLFLKANYVDVINEQLSAVKNLVNKADIEALVNSWLVSGVIGTSVVTVALNTLNLMVKDREDKIDFDYRASAVHGSTVVMSYFFGSVACTFITSSVLLSAGYVFLAATGTFCLTVPQMLQTYALTLLGSVSGTIVLMLFVSFFKKSSTFSAFSVLVSTSIGFIVGILSARDNLSPNVALFWKTGVCGGFTTFSTFSLEAWQLMEKGNYVLSVLYAALSVICCIAGVWVGRKLAGLTAV